MKAIVSILSLLLITNSAHALGTLDVPGDAPKPQAGSEFLAVSKAKPFLAWTGQEAHYLSVSTLGRLANKRANDICQYYGYSRGLVDVSTVKEMTDSGDGDYSVSYIQNGKLVVIPNTAEGFGSHIVVPSVFTKLTCYL